MADGPSAEDAATDLGDSDSRLTRERHKRQDASYSMTSSCTGQDIARRIYENASALETHPYHRQQHQYRPFRRNCHANPRRHNNNNNNNNSSGNSNHRREHENDENVDGSKERVGKNESGVGVDTTCSFASFASRSRQNCDEYDEYDEEDEDENVEDDEVDKADKVDKEGRSGAKGRRGVSKKCRGSARIDVTKMKNVTKAKNEESDSDYNGNGNGHNGSGSNNNGDSNGGWKGGSMTGHATHGGDNAGGVGDGGGGGCLIGDGRRSRSVAVGGAFVVDAMTISTSSPNESASDMKECRVDDEDNDNDEDEDEDEDENENEKKRERERERKREREQDYNNDRQEEKANRNGGSEKIGRDEEDVFGKTMDGIASDGSNSSSDGGNSSGGGSSSSGAAAAAAVSGSGSGGGAAGAAGVTTNGFVAGRHQGSPFKGQVRMAEDTLVGPCGKKRCADRYDSSESSDR